MKYIKIILVILLLALVISFWIPISDFDSLPEDAQEIIANMMFNMGRPRLSKFKGMKRGVDNRDWHEAADEMVDSAWYRQVPNRAERLVTRMRNIITYV